MSIEEQPLSLLIPVNAIAVLANCEENCGKVHWFIELL